MSLPANLESWGLWKFCPKLGVPDGCFSPDAPGRRFELEVFRNGECVATTRADLDRADVTAVFPAATCPWLDTALQNVSLFSTELATISLHLAGGTTALFDGPYVIGSRSAAVSAARSVARLGLSGQANVTDAERGILQAAIAQFLGSVRKEQSLLLRKIALHSNLAPVSTRINIIIPIFRGIEETRACIESVIANRHAATDCLVLVNDCSPEHDMPALLDKYKNSPNVFVITNETNLGFVGAVNRAISFCSNGHVLLLNSDTEIYPGVLDELCRVANSASDIGTVTAISNNATIFSYPHATLRVPA